MLKLTKLQLVCVAVMAILGVSYASAFNASSYSSSSKLASGKWVKITIPESGMYEITYDEMRAMGFTNPAQVRVYGRGGNRINELMSSSFSDDLNLVPILRKNNKICFYGNGPIGYTISNYNTTPHFTRVFNPYSQVGCYFLSDMSGSDLTPSKKTSVTVNNYISTTDCLSFFIHENELTSISSSGKEMLGEDFTTKPVYIDYKLPGLADSSIVVHTVIAVTASDLSYANAVIHSGGVTDTTVYPVSTSRIYKPASNVYYNFASPFAELKLTHPAEQGQFEPKIILSNADMTVAIARLDYFILTYKRNNVISEDDGNQLMMGYANTKGTEHFRLPNASSNVVVWGIDDVFAPKEVVTKTYNDETGTGRYFTSPSANVSMYVAFDPTKTLKKISAYETVENQNLHGMAVPDMLIITTKPFLAQAQRLADMHTAVDGIDVAVVDHEKIFNEFSSGTRDAMAYRLLCKMLYDRDVNKNKFKNLLLFGPGSFDNRELMGEHPTNLLTYQSDNSNYQDFSYTTDDFFGFLDDNSGSNIPSEKLRIGIGRITCADVEEAKSDVDKIVEYYATPDYGVWRNNNLVFSDSPEGGLYMFQGEGYKELIDTTLHTNTHVSTVHNSMYPRSSTEPTSVSVAKRTATEAKLQLGRFFKDGMNFATYVGHAGPVTFTKTNHMWTTSDVANTPYPRWPVMSTACCDVAHYDSDTRGIAELMFHKRNGGAIALMTSSRMVYATGNDRLNRYFISALFSHGSTGQMPTLGEAYMQAKLGFPTSDTNKMSFFLLGDPAIKFKYPISRFNITKVNGTDMTNSAAVATISPLTRFEIEARVVDADGNLDNTFNGDATMTLYDKQELFASLTLTENGASVDRDIYFNRPKLAEVSGRVTNGLFKATMVTPKDVLAKGDDVLIRAYAHKDDTDYMVNGVTNKVNLMAYDETVALIDTVAPVVATMYINDENSFSNGSAVGSSAMLYITATDDEAISVQANSLENGMTLLIDGGKSSYGDVKSFLTVSDEGRVVNIEYPLENLAPGMHTLTYTVFDIAGNFASRTLTFMVGGQGGSAELVADKWPAYKGSEVHFDLNTDLARTPEMTVRVTDATGKLVWMTKGSTFPVAWDMKDMSGNAVPAGLYRYFGTYNDGSNYGGTPINKLIVLDPLKTAN